MNEIVISGLDDYGQLSRYLSAADIRRCFITSQATAYRILQEVEDKDKLLVHDKVTRTAYTVARDTAVETAVYHHRPRGNPNMSFGSYHQWKAAMARWGK